MSFDTKVDEGCSSEGGGGGSGGFGEVVSVNTGDNAVVVAVVVVT